MDSVSVIAWLQIPRDHKILSRDGAGDAQVSWMDEDTNTLESGLLRDYFW